MYTKNVGYKCTWKHFSTNCNDVAIKYRNLQRKCSNKCGMLIENVHRMMCIYFPENVHFFFTGNSNGVHSSTELYVVL